MAKKYHFLHGNCRKDGEFAIYSEGEQIISVPGSEWAEMAHGEWSRYTSDDAADAFCVGMLHMFGMAAQAMKGLQALDGITDLLQGLANDLDDLAGMVGPKQ